VGEDFRKNGLLYAATNDFTGLNGSIYRWDVNDDQEWEELEPPNSAFFGLVRRQEVLYGAWDVAVPPDTPPGVDRTLYATYPVLEEEIEWDDLTTGLPQPGDVNYPVSFTREPSSLKVSGEGDITLWAIDDRQPYDYDIDTGIGCLWAYPDNLAKTAPWPTAPANASYVAFDPVTGRADEINFRWRQLQDAFFYEFELAKDSEFSQTILNEVDIRPPDDLSPAWILFPGFLEVNHDYYWRVRATGATTGEEIRSPWSATMMFGTQTGLPVTTPYYGPQLLAPRDACGCLCDAPISFSWSPYKGIELYQFELSEEADMRDPLISTKVNSTAYRYTGQLKCGKSYFWRVQSLEPFPSDWSATFSFKTIASKPSPAPKPPTLPSPRPIPDFLWLMVGIYVAIVITIIVFIRMFGRR
jgi:hypothetical protein